MRGLHPTLKELLIKGRLRARYKGWNFYHMKPIIVITDLKYEVLKRLVIEYLKYRIQSEKGDVMRVKIKYIENFYGVKFSLNTKSVINAILSEIGSNEVKVYTSGNNRKTTVHLFKVEELKRIFKK